MKYNKIVKFLVIKIIILLAKSWRISVVGSMPRAPAVIAFWHGEMLPVWKFFATYKPVAVVSLSKDGELLASVLSKWTYNLIRGSSSKKSQNMLYEMIETAKKKYILITPDGPRGPKNKFKIGAVITAQRANVPLVLLQCEIKNKKIFKKSWDSFELPLPFSKITIRIVDVYTIGADKNKEDMNKILLEIENKMNKK